MTPRIAKCLDVLRSQVNLAYPLRDKSNDGWLGDAAHAARQSDHNPDKDGVVRALDITNDPAHGVDARKLAQRLLDSRDPRLLYVISNAQMARSYPKTGTVPWQWSPYTGPNEHRQHCHISVVEDPVRYDDARPWAIGGKVLTPPMPKPSTSRFTGITATVFGGAGDVNTSAYDGHLITDREFGVALPFRFKGVRPKVRAWREAKFVDCEIVDVGPWNINDPYWETGHRPQAETGTDMTGRRTNKAGIDLTPAAARAIGLQGKGIIEWEFIGVDQRTWLQKLIDAIKALFIRS